MSLQPSGTIAIAAAGDQKDTGDSSAVNSVVADFPLLAFSEEEYNNLRRRYLEKRVIDDAELPRGGVRLRRQTKRAAIECNSPGYRALREKIRKLDVQQQDLEIYELLKQLADWESTQALRVIDLSQEEDSAKEQAGMISSVDTYIQEVLLLQHNLEPHTDEHDAEDEESSDLVVAQQSVPLALAAAHIPEIRQEVQLKNDVLFKVVVDETSCRCDI